MLARDYSLTGPESSSVGVPDGEWFRPNVSAERLTELSRRTDARAAVDVGAWLLMLVVAGVLAYRSLGSWWAVPAFAAYGALYGGSADPRWHECGHSTAFRSQWLNDAVYYLASFMQFRFFYLNMNYHVEHHLFPTVPYRLLPQLHDEVKSQLAPPTPSTFAAYRELVGALFHQRRDPTWEIKGRQIPDVVDQRISRSITGVYIDAVTVELCSPTAIGPGTVHRVNLADDTFVLCRLADGELALLDGHCTHGRAHLAEGALDGDQIECPKHNGRFDVRSGIPCRRPVTVAVRNHRVWIEGDRVLAQLETRSPT